MKTGELLEAAVKHEGDIAIVAKNIEYSPEDIHSIFANSYEQKKHYKILSAKLRNVYRYLTWDKKNIKNHELLEKAIKHEGDANTVATKTGYNKATISLIRANEYKGSSEKFFTKLKEVYDFLENGTVKCPGLKGDIHLKVCKSYREALSDGKTLKGTAFASVKEMCPFCPIGVKK
jgi:hypothetical protein